MMNQIKSFYQKKFPAPSRLLHLGSSPAKTNARKSESEPTGSSKRIKLDNETTSKSPVSSEKVEEMKDMINKTTKVWKPLVWIDCEMTGLNVTEDHIIEICCIITDGHLNVIDEKGYESTVYYPKGVLDKMNEWCVNQHGKSGLTKKVLDNPNQTLEKVENDLLAYIKKFVPEKRVGIMAGNSIHMDKFFMQREFSKVIEHLHYRLIDVSSIMEVGYRHNPKLMKAFPGKRGNHTARSDILESINQLKWYSKHYLKDEFETKDIIQDQEEQNNI